MADPAAIFALANKPTVALQDPNTVMGNALAVQNAANQNRLFQAQVARGNALAGAVDPVTGQLSPGGALAALARDPAGAPAMAEQANQSQALTGQQQQQAVIRNQLLGQAIGATLDAPPGEAHAAAAQGIARLQNAGLIDGQMASKMIQQMGPDDVSVRAQARQMQLSLQAPGAQQEQIFGSQSNTSTPGGMVSGTQASAAHGGGLTRATVTPFGVSASQAVTPETRMLPDGRSITAPAGTFMPPGVLPPGMQQGAPSSMGTGRYPQPAAQGMAGAGAQPGTTPPAPSGPAAAPAVPGAGGAPSVGLSPSQLTRNAADTEAFTKAQQQVPAANASVQNLQHAYDALQLTNAGKSTETTHAMYSLLSAQGLLPQGLTDDVKNYDLFRKYTEKYALNQSASSNTDAGRSMTAAANAGTAISTPANNDVLRNEIGNQRLAIAQAMEAPDQKTGTGFLSHAAQFSSQVDPRGFSIDMYTPDEVKKMVQAMPNDTARARFFKAAGMAQRLGMVSPRNPQPAGQ